MQAVLSEPRSNRSDETVASLSTGCTHRIQRVMDDAMILRFLTLSRWLRGEPSLSEWLGSEGFDLDRPIAWSYDNIKGWWIASQEVQTG